MILSNSLVILDLETTGTWIEKDKIVEIAMIKCLLDGSQEVFTMRTNPGIPIPQNVTQIIGISNDDIKDAPCFKDIAEEVLLFINNADIGGFNVERFDLLILKREFDEAGFKFELDNRNVYDAQKIYHTHEKRDLTAAYIFYCNKILHDAHSALSDVKATLEIIKEQIKRYGDYNKGIESLKNNKNTHFNEYFDKDRKFRWWNKNLYPTFGKYAAKKSIKEIAKIDHSYLEWILEKDFNIDVKTMIRSVLNGKFPEFPEI